MGSRMQLLGICGQASRGVGLETVLSSWAGLGGFPVCWMGSISAMTHWLGIQVNLVPWPEGAIGSADAQNFWLACLVRCCCEQGHYPQDLSAVYCKPTTVFSICIWSAVVELHISLQWSCEKRLEWAFQEVSHNFGQAGCLSWALLYPLEKL